MQCRTEMTVEELLAEPIVLTLMESDGISVEEARNLYARVRSGAKRTKKRQASGLTDRAGIGLRVRPSETHMPCCM
jgi:hypothetical protein